MRTAYVALSLERYDPIYWQRIDGGDPNCTAWSLGWLPDKLTLGAVFVSEAVPRARAAGAAPKAAGLHQCRREKPNSSSRGMIRVNHKWYFAALHR
jgi:hypothetical protein